MFKVSSSNENKENKLAEDGGNKIISSGEKKKERKQLILPGSEQVTDKLESNANKDNEAKSDSTKARKENDTNVSISTEEFEDFPSPSRRSLPITPDTPRKFSRKEIKKDMEFLLDVGGSSCSRKRSLTSLDHRRRSSEAMARFSLGSSTGCLITQ